MLESIPTAAIATGRMLQLASYLKKIATVILYANFMVIVVMTPREIQHSVYLVS